MTQAALFTILISCCSQTYAYNYGDPSANEQAHLEAINRARLNPVVEAERLGIDLFEGLSSNRISVQSVQPLSSNAQLLAAARVHSKDMLQRQFFAHNNPDGQTAFDRMNANGYDFISAGENIAFIGSTAYINPEKTSQELHDILFRDKDFPGRGHRINILTADFREVGIGLEFGEWLQDGTVFNAGMITTDFGSRGNELPIVLGVVYDDFNNNQLYDPGEGIEGVQIKVLETNDSTYAASAGGYGLELNQGDYTFEFSHPDYGAIIKTIQVDNHNVKLDALRSDFSETGYASQCGIFANNRLYLPCVTVADRVYTANLNVSNASPLTLVLDEIQPVEISVTEQCPMYTVSTETLYLPCVLVKDKEYWADLTLADDDPITLELMDFGLNSD